MTDDELAWELGTVENELQAVDIRIARLQAERAGLKARAESLRSTLSRLVPGLGTEPDTQPEAGDLANTGRTRAIEAVLTASDGALSIKDVIDELRRRGRSETNYQAVVSTLRYLVRTGRIGNPRRGLYSSGDPTRVTEAEREHGDFEAVWQRIKAHQGETFHLKRGGVFSYEVRDNALAPDRTDVEIGRSQFEQAHVRMPVTGPGDLRDLFGPSYLWAILSDDRIAEDR